MVVMGLIVSYPIVCLNEAPFSGYSDNSYVVPELCCCACMTKSHLNIRMVPVFKVVYQC